MASAAGDTVVIACPSRTHFSVEAGAAGVARVYCRDRRCKKQRDEVTIHYFDLATGDILTTRRYARPPRASERDAANTDPLPLASARASLNRL